MGSTSGKYSMKDGNRRTTIPSNLLKMKKPKCIHQKYLSNEKDNLTIVWVDTEMHHQPSNIDIQVKLKNLVRYLRIFDKLDAFEHYIKQIDPINDEKFFVIISTPLALPMIPNLHRLSSIKSIYIYGRAEINKKTKAKLVQTYPKVKGIFSKCQYLIAQISLDKST